MKHLFLIFIVSISTLSARAAQYSCKDREGSTTTLFVSNGSTTIRWQDEDHSAESKGIFKGTEEAPFSELKGFLLFSLVDFYRSSDSEFVLAIQDVKGRSRITAVEYFDSDDHIESERVFTCDLKSN